MSDQTQFSEHEPWLEDSLQGTVANDPVDQAEKAPPTGWRAVLQKFKLPIGLAAGATVALALVLWMMMPAAETRLDPRQLLEASPVPSAPPTTYQRRLNEASLLLEQADPAIDILPFPPVAENIELEVVE